MAATIPVTVTSLNTYSPNFVVIQPGDTVQWNWSGSFHSVTSDTGAWADSGVHNTGFTFSVQFNAPGSYPYHCSFHGFFMSGTVIVSAPPTTTSLNTSKTPTVIGESATLTATVTPVNPSGNVPTGTVTFYDNAATVLCDSVPVDGSATATCSTAPLTVGSHSMTANYSGDSNFSNSSGGPITQTVNKGDTTTGLISSKNPADVCESVMFTATPAVLPPAVVPGPITGTMTFFDGASQLCTGSLVSGSAQCSAGFTVGSHSITAQYGGNTQLNGSTSSPPLTQTIQAPIVAAPAAIAATAQTGTSIKLEWPAVVGATGYEIGRRAVRTDVDTILSVPAGCSGGLLSYVDAAPSADATYIYRIRAIGSNVSDWSNPDIATTFYFTNRPALNVPITATDMAQLRHAANLVHAAAGFGTSITFTNDPLTQNESPILALDLLALRHAMTDDFGLIGVATIPYTDSDETALQNQTVPVKAIHFTELQDAVQ